MHIGIILSPAIIFPSLQYPYYLDYFDMLKSLAKKHTLYVAGDIREKLDFVEAQLTYSIETDPSLTQRTVKKFGKKLLKFSYRNPMFAKLRNNFEQKEYSKLEERCYEFFKANDVDVFYAFPFFPETFQVSAANKLGKPVVCEFWEDQIVFRAEIMYHKGYEKEIIAKEMQRGYDWFKKVINKSSKVIVPSEVLKRSIEKMGFENKVRTIPVCANLPPKN